MFTIAYSANPAALTASVKGGFRAIVLVKGEKELRM